MTALPFAMPSKVNLFPSVVQIVFSNLLGVPIDRVPTSK